AGAVQMVTVQGRQPTEVAREPGICIDTLRFWLKAVGVQMGQVSRSNRDQQRIKELESFPLRSTAMCRSGAGFVAAATGQVSLLPIYAALP
ncbi:MAG: hypothetical protein LIO54_02890, partial [Oscillospiraceae bacterium]|nr:hypothetical protein [Oscillospiraceae bacterium]